MSCPGAARRSEASRTRRLLIAGIGRAEFGDDAAGLEAAGRLAERLAGVAGVTILLDTGWALLHRLEMVDTLVLVDAAEASSRLPAGEWVRLRYPAAREALESCGLRDTHSAGIAALLELAAAMGVLPEETWIFALAGEGFAPETGLSPPVAAALDGFVEAIASHVRQRRMTPAAEPEKVCADDTDGRR